MRTLTIEKTVYTFDELSDKAKDAVIYGQYFEFDSECVTEDFKTVAYILGFYDITPRWSGFSSQGDGASFTGRYQYVKGAARKIREYAPQDKELHAIADALQDVQRRNFYRLRASLTLGVNSNYYAHENTISIEVWDTDNDCRDLNGDDDVVVELCRDLMRWFYKQLETEYNYQTSVEYIAELCEANGYEFYEDGVMIC